MSPIKDYLTSIYNPANQQRDDLISNFVIRLKELDELFNAINQDKMETPPQHFIIQGQRGYGKTTLLWRIFYKIKAESHLSSWLIPVLFNEEQYNITSLAKLWEEISEYLEKDDEAFEGLKEKVSAILDDEDDEEKAFDTLIASLKKNRKKIVLLWDNFGQVFDKFTRKDRQRMREVLITCSHMRIVGASAVTLEYNFDYSEPFYEFFKILNLDELDTSETIALLRKLGESYKASEINKVIDNQPGRIEALRRLTGGVPRTIVLLFEIFADNVDGQSFKDLEKLLDNITPLYKHRMDDLPKQQQPIVDVIAMNWDAISVKDIAAKTRIQSKTVSSQLNLLEKNQIIVKIPTTTKNNLYQIRERFFNIWYLMRHSRRNKRNQVRWLVEFLETWCCANDLALRARQHILSLKKGNIDERHAYYMTQALAKTALPSDLQDNLIKDTRNYLIKNKSEFAPDLNESRLEVSEKIIKYLAKGEDSSAINEIKKQNYTDHDVYFILGKTYAEQMANVEKAEQYYLQAIQQGESRALNNLANLYAVELKDFAKAEQYYLQAIQQGDSQAMFNLAYLYTTELKDFAKAEQYYLQAIEQGESRALNNLANLYAVELKDFAKAEQYYLKAIEQGDSRALNNLANFYTYWIGDFSKAEHYYLKAIEQGDSRAMNSLSWHYFQQKNKKAKALQYAENSFRIQDNIYNKHTYAMVLLWHNETEQALNITDELTRKIETHEKIPADMQLLFIMLLAKKQFQFVYNLFLENLHDIKARYKPIYYAMLYFMRDCYADEYRKMGSELEETVLEIVEAVKKMEIDYA